MAAKELTEIPIIETVHLKLRKISMDDIDDIFEYASNPEVTKFVLWYEHKTRNDSIDFVKFAEEQFLSNSSIVWGIELKENKKLIGSIDLREWNTRDRCGNIGYAVSKDYWNKGFTTEAMRAVINFGFNQLQLNRIESHCEEENKGSWRVMEKCGMTYEGTLREKVFIKNRFRSMKMYSILRNEREKV